MAQQFIAQQLAEHAAGKTIALVARVPHRVRSYADQVVRATGSVALNLSEGFGRLGKDKQYHYSVAYASAREASAALRILVASGSVPEATVAEVERLLDQVRAIAWRLIRPQPA